jgi:TRAP transporter TAXI family solute receptor
MRKRICILLLLVAVVWVGLLKDASAATQISIGSGSVGGILYNAANFITQCLNKSLPEFNFTAETTAGTIENLRLMQAGQMTVAVATPQVGYEALNGLPPWKEKVSFRVIMSLVPVAPILTSLKNSGITSHRDLKGKKVGVGPAGGGMEPMVKSVLEEYGMDYKDIKPVFIGLGPGVDALKGRTVDATMLNPDLIDSLTLTNSVNLLTVDEKTMKNITTQYPYISMVRYPANRFKDIHYEVITPGYNLALVAKTDLSEQTVYKITKAIVENLKCLQEVYAPAKIITPQWAAAKLYAPFHPGAIKYYKEINVLKD